MLAFFIFDCTWATANAYSSPLGRIGVHEPRWKSAHYRRLPGGVLWTPSPARRARSTPTYICGACIYVWSVENPTRNIHESMSVNPSSLSMDHSPSPRPESPEPGPSRKRPRTTSTSAEDRKAARAHRNRIAAQNSCDRRKAQFTYVERRSRLDPSHPTVSVPRTICIPQQRLISTQDAEAETNSLLPPDCRIESRDVLQGACRRAPSGVPECLISSYRRRVSRARRMVSACGHRAWTGWATVPQPSQA
ncbi:hypothetical protein DFH08DRAFT_178246 [Mycena albidolilacea]|uniref:BZIP domain-containing protein n=1 Tax=Mycena albidolilacea TaxID=1033008 RepID=A0AAD7AS18_9AGAR|nr:hypothetical protein DFH08DRAFT_178246 [Mycena albidolilacea]